MSGRRFRRGRISKPETPGEGLALGQCETSRKWRWPTRALARAHLRDLKAKGDLRASSLSTYRHDGPDGCGDWHVGHRSRKRR